MASDDFIEVDKPESNEARGLLFWSHLDNDKRELLATRPNTFCRQWCERHRIAHNSACPACMKEEHMNVSNSSQAKVKNSMAKKAANGRQQTGTKEMEIRVALEPNVLEFKRNKLIDVENTIDKLTAKKRDVAAEWTSKLKDAREQRAALLEEIESGRQRMRVNVIERRDDRRGFMLIVRADTGAVVDERPYTASEAQLELEESIRQKQEDSKAGSKNSKRGRKPKQDPDSDDAEFVLEESA